MQDDWLTIGVLLLVGLTAGVTLFVAFLLWRDGYRRGWRAARTHPPACPQCGYQLSGLQHCRCPECGSSYTIDQLWSHAFIAKPTRGVRPPPFAKGEEWGTLTTGGGESRSDDRRTGEVGRASNDSQHPVTEH